MLSTLKGDLNGVLQKSEAKKESRHVNNGFLCDKQKRLPLISLFWTNFFHDLLHRFFRILGQDLNNLSN
jgi:hypothetical protein